MKPASQRASEYRARQKKLNRKRYEMWLTIRERRSVIELINRIRGDHERDKN